MLIVKRGIYAKLKLIVWLKERYIVLCYIHIRLWYIMGHRTIIYLGVLYQMFHLFTSIYFLLEDGMSIPWRTLQ